ncbi:hypothetical protein MUP38_00785 [Candidatus Bathyarchaeota archaeon]|nr:hypothetical protein [Candidatus Bathyarchaeota archaeon]
MVHGSGKNDYADPFDPTVWIAEEPFEIVLPGGNATPEEALAKSRKIIASMKAPAPTKLTVGDLSVVSAEEKKRKKAWSEKRVNRSDAVSIGDLSMVPDASKGLQDLFVGANLVPKPSTSKSQEMQMAMQRKQRKKREEIFEIKQVMFARKVEDEAGREAAKQTVEQMIREADERLYGKA